MTGKTSALLGAQIQASLKQVFDAQEDRVRLLNDFDQQFKIYLLDAPEFNLETLKTLCKTTSERMNEISARIIRVRDEFSPDCFGVQRIYELVNRLQENEQAKFKLMLELCVYEQERLEKLVSTDEFEPVYSQKMSQLKHELNQIKEDINDCLEEMRYELHESD